MCHGSPTTLDQAPLTLAAAAQQIRANALVPGRVGSVGLEVESHLVDLDHPNRQVPWARIRQLAPVIEAAAAPHAVSFEPGGQVELSGPPHPGPVGAVAAMRDGLQRVRMAMTDYRVGLALVGADPARALRRVNPRPRYVAMERHFAARGQTEPAVRMMCATAALQVNLDAGPAAGWADRVSLAQQLGPVLSAIAASSPWVTGHATGAASARQQAWAALSPPARVDVDPAGEWARYALAAPVMFVRRGTGAIGVPGRVSFGQWLTGTHRLDGRTPSEPDLTTHLSTLFPPVRLRGYLEIRYLDMTAPRWWPAVATVTTVLLDNPRAADLAREAIEPVTDRWHSAAQHGLRDRRLASVARRCLQIAAAHTPPALATAVEDLADLIATGRSPGDLLADRITQIGPTAALEEMAHA